MGRTTAFFRWGTGGVGRAAIRSVNYVLDLTYFTTRSIRDWRRRTTLANRATLGTLYGQIIFSGVDALPLVSLFGLATATAVTAQILGLAQAFGNEQQMIRLVVNLVGLELSSLLAAVALVSRTGSAIAVDLGNMKLHGEVEGLELLGISVNDFFVTPRLIGVAISQLALAIYLGAIALFGGVIISSLLNDPRHLDYMLPIATGFHPAALALFAFKNLLFGLIIAATSCFHGLRVVRSPTEVPQQTQGAIVHGLILIFFIDGLLAVVIS